MTTEQANEYLAEIQKLAGDSFLDDEKCHNLEDKFHQAVLVAIVEGAPNPVELAQVALRTSDLNFARWCA